MTCATIASPGAGARSRVTSPLQTRSFRAMLLWQAIATAAIAAVAGVVGRRQRGAGRRCWAASINLAANVLYALRATA